MAHWATQGRALSGWALCEAGHKEIGLAQLRQALSTYPISGTEVERPRLLILLAEVLAKGGETKANLSALTEAIALTQPNRGSHYLEAELCRLQGESLLLQAGANRAFEDAEQCFQQAREIAQSQQAKSLELRTVLSLGRLWYQQGKQDEVRHLLTACRAEFVEGFDTADLEATQAVLETLR